METEDQIRDRILKFLYEFNKSKAEWIAPVVVVNSLKREGFERNAITRNINFLKDEGYINKRIDKAGGISYEKVMISSKGTQLFEESKFTKKPFSTIALAGSNNVLVMGNNLGSITQTKGDSIDELDALIDQVRKSTLTEEEKMNLIGDVETIKSQLVKPNPSKQIIKASWTAITAAANFSRAHDLIGKIKELLVSWLS